MPPGLDEAAIFLAGILVMLGIVGLGAARREIESEQRRMVEWRALSAEVQRARADFDTQEG